MQKPVRHGAIALVRRGRNWLVARRHEEAHLGGLWEFPGGKCEAGESPEAAAMRELREECGIEGVARRALDAIEHDYGDRVIHLTPVVCDWVAGEAQALGNAECRWVPLAELCELAMPAANGAIVSALIAEAERS